VKRESKGGATLDLEGTWQHTVAVNKTKSWTKVSIGRRDRRANRKRKWVAGWDTGAMGSSGPRGLPTCRSVKIRKAPPRR